MLAIDSGNPERDRRARTLNAILLVALPAALITAVAVFPFKQGPLSAATFLVAASCLLGVLGLSHAGHLDVAVALFAVLLWLLTVIQPAITGDLSVNVLLVPVAAVMLVYVIPPRQRWWLLVWVVSALVVLLLTTDDADTLPVTRVQWLSNTAVSTAAIVAVVIYGARELASAVRRQRHLAEELSARERTMQRLQELATTDPLTGFLNRRALEHDFPDLAPQAAVALIDLDRFKGVNDAFSHAIGDRVLADFSAVVAEAASPEDRLYRLGGDEFLVVRRTASAASLAELLHKIRADLHVRADNGRRITFSCGVVEVAGDDLSATLTRADRAMYAAKQAGRDAIVVID